MRALKPRFSISSLTGRWLCVANIGARTAIGVGNSMRAAWNDFHADMHAVIGGEA